MAQKKNMVIFSVLYPVGFTHYNYMNYGLQILTEADWQGNDFISFCASSENTTLNGTFFVFYFSLYSNRLSPIIMLISDNENNKQTDIFFLKAQRPQEYKIN